MDMKKEKNILRRKSIEMANSLDSKKIDLLSQEVLGHILNSYYFKKSDSIFIFVGMNHEINTQLFIPDLLKEKRVFIPYTPAKAPEMKMTEIYSLNELEPGAMNILNIRQDLVEDRLRETVDLVLAPALLFDNEGYRLGYGGGYYDRFLAMKNHKYVLGLGLSHQRVDRVPRDKFDLPLQGFISDQGLEYFGPPSSD